MEKDPLKYPVWVRENKRWYRIAMTLRQIAGIDQNQTLNDQNQVIVKIGYKGKTEFEADDLLVDSKTALNLLTRED